MKLPEGNFLVTGCGGDIGQSILKVLKSHFPDRKIVGCDIHNFHAGVLLADQVFLVPKVHESDYTSALSEICDREKVNWIISASEPELRFFSLNTLPSIEGVKWITANLQARIIGFDKYKTAEFLRDHHLPFPYTTLISDEAPENFPLLSKSRTGSGSKNIVTIQNQSDFEAAKILFPDSILQEIISDNEGEFTAGLFRSTSGEVRSIIFWRTLLGGFSGYGKVVTRPIFAEFLRTLARHLDLCGSINVQFRVKNELPIVFEINPRFSSTVRFRDLMGFQDLIWSILDAEGIELPPYFYPEQGKTFYKGFTEWVP